jgi:hypothetical protein
MGQGLVIGSTDTEAGFYQGQGTVCLDGVQRTQRIYLFKMRVLTFKKSSFTWSGPRV